MSSSNTVAFANFLQTELSELCTIVAATIYNDVACLQDRLAAEYQRQVLEFVDIIDRLCKENGALKAVGASGTEERLVEAYLCGGTSGSDPADLAAEGRGSSEGAAPAPRLHAPAAPSRDEAEAFLAEILPVEGGLVGQAKAVPEEQAKAALQAAGNPSDFQLRVAEVMRQAQKAATAPVAGLRHRTDAGCSLQVGGKPIRASAEAPPKIRFGVPSPPSLLHASAPPLLRLPPAPFSSPRASVHSGAGHFNPRLSSNSDFEAASCPACGSAFAAESTSCGKCGARRQGAKPRVQFGSDDSSSTSSKASQVCSPLEGLEGSGFKLAGTLAVPAVSGARTLWDSEASGTETGDPSKRASRCESVATEEGAGSPEGARKKGILLRSSSVNSNMSLEERHLHPRSSKRSMSASVCTSIVPEVATARRSKRMLGDADAGGVAATRMSQTEGRMSKLSERDSKAEAGRFDVVPPWSMEAAGANRRRVSSQQLNGFFGSTCLDGEDKFDDLARACGLRWFMINPNSFGRLAWDLHGLLLIFYDCINVPLEVFDPAETGFSRAMTWIIRLFWTVNVAVSFLVGYMRGDGVVEMRPLKVARRYMCTWFLLDMFVLLFDWTDFVADSNSFDLTKVGTALRGLRLVRAARLLPLLKAPQMSSKLSEYVPMGEQLGLLATIIKIMFFFLWITHIFACLWFGLGRLCGEGGGASWLVTTSELDNSMQHQYMLSFHWSLAAFSGDTGSVVPPSNVWERAFACIVLFLGNVLSASVVGGITTSMTRLQIILSEQTSKLAVLRRFLVDNHISRPLAVRVQRNAQHAMLEQKTKAPESSVELLAIISQPVLMEVHYEIHSRTLLTHPFMLAYNDVNLAGLRRVCHSAISVLSLHSKDVLFSDLEVPEPPKMFYVVGGRLMYQQTRRSVAFFERGAWICEANLWTRWIHCGTLRAVSESRLLVLDAVKFQEIISSFPSDHASLYAHEFVDWLNEVAVADQSDQGPSKEECTDMVERAFPLEEDGDDDGCEASGERRSSGRGSSRMSSGVWKRGASWLLGTKQRNSTEKGIVARLSAAVKVRVSRRKAAAGNLLAALWGLVAKFRGEHQRSSAVMEWRVDQVVPDPC